MIKQNLDNNNNIVVGEDIKYGFKDLRLVFEKLLTNNNFTIKNSDFSKSIKNVVATKNGIEFTFHFVLRNIVGAGWTTKPNIKRIQVQNFKDVNPMLFEKTTKNHYFFYVGYYNYDNNPLFIFWDPGRYDSHKTNRSCYVLLNSMQRAHNHKFLETVNVGRKVWIIKEERFNEFLNKYRTLIEEEIK